ncbi:MAG: transketolase [Planctomycetota bacterium]|nr:transketolase [Planctomycetota bacterium]
MLMSQVSSLDRLCIDTIRTLSIDAVEKAHSGHPGLPLGAAPMAYALWQRHLRHDPSDPSWPDRDRFVLSAGHGSMLLYSLLHLTGYDLSLDEIKSFRQWGSKTPGHPELGLTPGVEATTGPLGQGSVNAVGMAMAERFLAARYNRPGHEIVGHFTYALVSDGDMMEGLSAEAGSLAGHLGLGRLTYLYDANDVSLDGPCSLSFTEDVAGRYESYGWHVQTVAAGDTDVDAIDAAIQAAKRETARPSLIVVKTTIGFGSPNKAGSAACHGSPLGADEVKLTKEALGWSEGGEFVVPAAALEHFRVGVERGRAARSKWKERCDAWAAAHPSLADEWRRGQAGELPEGWDADLPRFEPGAKLATREAGGKVLNAIAARVPFLFGGDADLGCSTKTLLDGEADFGGSGAGRNVRYGVREHAMGAIANGIAYHGGARTYTATFFIFSDYMRPAIRLAAMNRLPIVHVFTHDSIALGEDGPMHQPVEHLMSLRAMPNQVTLRPADPTETVAAWRFALQSRSRPVALVLSRQKVPALDRDALAPAENLVRGAYVLADPAAGKPRAILIATGTEVHLALAARDELARAGVPVRVVSMPSFELFEEQDEAYRESVLPVALTARVSIEAGATFGWDRWIGPHGVALGLDRFGSSAPGPKLFEELGFTVERVVRSVRDVIEGIEGTGRSR